MCCHALPMTPEDGARALLARAGLDTLKQPPVDAEWIAVEHLDIDVQEHPDLRSVPGAPALAPGAALSGLLLPHKRRIWVDAQEARRSSGRRLFTIAHELGHWELHRDDGPARFCRSEEVGWG